MVAAPMAPMGVAGLAAAGMMDTIAMAVTMAAGAVAAAHVVGYIMSTNAVRPRGHPAMCPAIRPAGGATCTRPAAIGTAS